MRTLTATYCILLNFVGSVAKNCVYNGLFDRNIHKIKRNGVLPILRKI